MAIVKGTAQEMRVIAETVPVNKKKAELEEVLETIRKAANEGQLCESFGFIDEDIKIELQKLGFSIRLGTINRTSREDYGPFKLFERKVVDMLNIVIVSWEKQ